MDQCLKVMNMYVKKLKALISFSKVASPEDNSEIESFFGRLKDEWKKTFYQAKTKEEIFQLISRQSFIIMLKEFI
jgi:transposase InsO family protein